MANGTYKPQIDPAVIRDTSLPPLTRLVYVALAIYADHETGECFPSQKTIADDIGIKERAVRNHLQALIDAGYVEVVKRRRQDSTILRLIDSRPAPPCRSKTVKTGTVAHQDRHGDDIKTGTTVPPNRSKNRSKNNKGAVPVVIPENLDRPDFLERWALWIAHRAELAKSDRKAKLTSVAIDRMLAKLAKWGPDRAVAAIDESVAQGWKGIFEPKGDGHSGNGATSEYKPLKIHQRTT
ncbi:MAG: helix-turn-helix domain-containing protein [Pirellulaceae bacterium]|jgi:hypothetical protein|nr:helix-turn-helix domain-containing protein [Pirellulaceae bacterium]